MLCAYIDTSALAKWYLPEVHSEEFSIWIQQQKNTCISSLTVTEFRCMLARRQRRHDLTEAQVQQIYASLEQDISDGHLKIYPVNGQQVQNAALLIDSLPNNALRTLDAIHLSIARDIPATLLASADQVMLNAGKILGFQLVCFD